MIRNALRRIADVRKDDSFVTKLRLKRIALFRSLVSHLPKPLRILDVGGTELFWYKMGFVGDKNFRITLLNLSETETNYPNFESVVGDARNMHEFRDDEFDLAFSNSVIEHVGSYLDQQYMAEELQRVGKRYFLQTPNFYFPLEPHFLFPFFHFFPLWLRVFLVRHFNLGWRRKTTNKRKAIELVNSVRLLKKMELKKLFPEATIKDEKFLGLTVSFIVFS